jgi:hypothetical protein
MKYKYKYIELRKQQGGTNGTATGSFSTPVAPISAPTIVAPSSSSTIIPSYDQKVANEIMNVPALVEFPPNVISTIIDYTVPFIGYGIVPFPVSLDIGPDNLLYVLDNKGTLHMFDTLSMRKITQWIVFDRGTLAIIACSNRYINSNNEYLICICQKENKIFRFYSNKGLLMQTTDMSKIIERRYNINDILFHNNELFVCCDNSTDETVASIIGLIYRITPLTSREPYKKIINDPLKTICNISTNRLFATFKYKDHEVFYAYIDIGETDMIVSDYFFIEFNSTSNMFDMVPSRKELKDPSLSVPPKLPLKKIKFISISHKFPPKSVTSFADDYMFYNGGIRFNISVFNSRTKQLVDTIDMTNITLPDGTKVLPLSYVYRNNKLYINMRPQSSSMSANASISGIYVVPINSRITE